MRIWIVSPYGPIPSEGWRDHRYVSLGRTLAARGHEVVWWTATFAHQFKTRRSFSGNRIEVTPGFEIRFVPTPSYRRNIGFGRLWFEAIFGWRVWRAARALAGSDAARPDWVVAGEPPKSGGIAARRLAALAGARFAVDVYDVWPELWVSLTPAGLRPLVAAITAPLAAIRRSLIRDAALTIAVNETYARVARAEGASRVEVVYIGVDVGSVGSSASDNAPAHAVYAGSLGINYDIPTLLRAAELLADSPVNVRISVAGDGPMAEAVRAAAERLPNLSFRGRLDQAALADLYSEASVGLATYGTGSTVALPIKLYDYLAAGLPIVNSLRGEMADIVSRNNVGINYEAGNAESLAAAILAVAGEADRRAASAARARELAHGFSVAAQYRRFAELLEEPCPIR